MRWSCGAARGFYAFVVTLDDDGLVAGRDGQVDVGAGGEESAALGVVAGPEDEERLLIERDILSDLRERYLDERELRLEERERQVEERERRLQERECDPAPPEGGVDGDGVAGSK
jgi:hypothetical protein